jgi:hypothetical protein
MHISAKRRCDAPVKHHHVHRTAARRGWVIEQVGEQRIEMAPPVGGQLIADGRDEFR